MKLVFGLMVLFSTVSAHAITFFNCTDVDGVASAKTYEFVIGDKLTFRYLTYLEIDGEVIYKSRLGGKNLPGHPIVIDEFSVSGHSVGISLEHEGQELELVCEPK